ncbi:MAG: aldose epimerase, partial [Acidimicrobiales bacterium]
PADPVLHWPDGCAVTISSSCDHWVIYDEPTHALCVEPQSGPPDAITLAPVLAEPGRPVDHTMTWRW